MTDTLGRTTYNTTLKAIVPLPESPDTLPTKDYTIGHDVLAVYPDTSCFYRAIVRGGGPGLKGIDKVSDTASEAQFTIADYRRTGELHPTCSKLLTNLPLRTTTTMSSLSRRILWWKDQESDPFLPFVCVASAYHAFILEREGHMITVTKGWGSL